MEYIEWEISQYGDLPEDEMPDDRAMRADKYAAAKVEEIAGGLAKAIENQETWSEEVDAALAAYHAAVGKV